MPNIIRLCPRAISSPIEALPLVTRTLRTTEWYSSSKKAKAAARVVLFFRVVCIIRKTRVARGLCVGPY